MNRQRYRALNEVSDLLEDVRADITRIPELVAKAFEEEQGTNEATICLEEAVDLLKTVATIENLQGHLQHVLHTQYQGR